LRGPAFARRRPGAALRVAISAEDLARATRLLRLRSHREATGLFAGSYASAFRGSGLEFEESRPYVPGDDVAAIDWNATARAGQLFVRIHREERNQTLVFGLDASASMGFGTTGTTKAAAAARAVALLVAAAGRAGDRTALVSFDEAVRDRIAPGRGGAHGLRVIREVARRAAAPRGATRLAAGLRALRAFTRRRAVVLVVSDFRDPELLPPDAEPTPLRAALAEIAAHHELIALPVVDPAAEELPRVGALRVADPERPGRVRLLATGRERVRRRYREAAQARRSRLERELRHAGAETLWLSTGASPLQTLASFFRERAARRASVRAPLPMLLALLALPLLAPGCRRDPPPTPAAPPAPRAALLLEPPRLLVGEVATLELAIVTPPGHAPLPYAPPGEIPGLSLVSVEALPVETEAARWIHRTAVRVRSRDTGSFVWPASRVAVEAPDGSHTEIELAELPIEVVSVLPEHAGRTAPFGPRPPPAPAAAVPFWGAAAAGASAAFALAGLVALARRRRTPRAVAPPPEAAPGPPPWERALAELARARDALEPQPFAAAHATSMALRRYVEARFGADAAGRTGEELVEIEPPFAAASRWPSLLALLGALDELRFRPAHDTASRAALSARLPGLVADAQRFVEASVPPEGLR
jgi:uncharacterized protein (DUF58 family)